MIQLSLSLCLLGTLTLGKLVAAGDTIKLSSGYEMPVVGLGTWQIAPDDIDLAVTTALENGYRHIDTAYVYENEAAIGQILEKWWDHGGKREDLFITTKLPPYANRPSDVERALNESLERLCLDYVDMYLIHVPTALKSTPDKLGFTFEQDGTVAFDLEADLVQVWKEMEKQVKAGRARSIGVSNFNEKQIKRILRNAEIKPSNLQIELQAYNQQRPLRNICALNNVTITSYSSLGSPGTKHASKTSSFLALVKLMENPTVVAIAVNHNKTAAQVLLRHLVQSGIVVIPKSTRPERIKENIDIFDFELSEDEMKQMDGLDQGYNGRLFDFKSFKGIEKHPEYPFIDQLEEKTT